MIREAEITIDSIVFEKGGAIFFEGTVEGTPIEGSIEGRDFEGLLKKGFDYLNDDNDYIGRMDDFGGLHLLAKLDGAVVWHHFNLNPIIKDRLLEQYHKNQ